MVNTWQKKTSAFLVLVLVGIVGYLCYWQSNTGYLGISLKTEQSTTIRIFWTSAQEKIFHPAESTILKVNGRKRRYIVPITNLKDIKNIRIDPGNLPESKLEIHKISFYQDGYADLRFSRIEDFESISHNGPPNITNVEISETGMEITTGIGDGYGKSDPQIYISLAMEQNGSSAISNIFRVFVFALVLFLAIYYWRCSVVEYRYVTYALVLIMGLISTMAVISYPNTHPDEYAHSQAASYYKFNAIPPKVCSAETQEAYTRYGVSRLNSYELTYYIAGSFSRLLDFIPADDTYKHRFFNLLLFLFIIVLASKSLTFRILCIPLLCSPQAWYVFSYFNTEAFSVFICLMIAYQILEENSLFRRCVTRFSGVKLVLGVLFCAALIVLLLGVKKNFYLYIIFLAFWAFIAVVFNKNYRAHIKSMLVRSMLIISVAAFSFSGWVILKNAINEFQLSENIYDCRNELARYDYKPSTPVDETAPSLYWKQKGISFESMLSTGWGSSVFKSAFGVYGYLEYPSGDIYYSLMKSMLIVLLAYISLAILFKSSWTTKLLLGGFIGAFAGLIMMTAWNSWTKDYQAQGRYYLSLFPILGILLFTSRKDINPNIVAIIVSIMFMCSLYSFAYIGLLEIR